MITKISIKIKFSQYKIYFILTFLIQSTDSPAQSSPWIKIGLQCGPRWIDEEWDEEDERESGEDGQEDEEGRRVEEKQVQEHAKQAPTVVDSQGGVVGG